MSDKKPGRPFDTEARARIHAVLNAEDCSTFTHERVAELAKSSEHLVKEVRKARGEKAGSRRRSPPPAPRAPKPKPVVPQPLSKQQGIILTRIIDLAKSGRDTRRLLEIRALLRTTTGLELQAVASLAQGAA